MKIQMLSLTLLCMAHCLYGSNDQLPMNDKKALIDGLIKIQAQEYLNKLPAPQQTCELAESDVTYWLTKCQKHADTILSDKTPAATRDKKMDRELRMIEDDLGKMFALNHIDHNPNARLCFFYADIVKTTFAHILRIQLGCYAGELMNYEKGYPTQLEKVSGEEFGKRFRNAYSEEQKNRLLMRTSSLIAQKTLELYRQQQAQEKPITAKAEASI